MRFIALLLIATATACSSVEKEDYHWCLEWQNTYDDNGEVKGSKCVQENPLNVHKQVF